MPAYNTTCTCSKLFDTQVVI